MVTVGSCKVTVGSLYGHRGTLYGHCGTLYGHCGDQCTVTVESRYGQCRITVWTLWGVNQAYSRLSTTHGHITDCKLDSVVYAGHCGDHCMVTVGQCMVTVG